MTVEKRGGLPTYINSIATALKRENPTWSTSRVIQTAVNAVKKMCSTGRAFNGKAQVSPAVQSAACTAVASWNAKKAGASEEIHEAMELAEQDDFIDLAEDVSDKPWSQFQESDYTDEQFIRACLIKGDSKSTSKFPVREPDGTLNKNGVHAAASRVSSGNLSPDQVKSLKGKLRGLYKQLGETPPESLSLSEITDEEFLIYALSIDAEDVDGEEVTQLEADKYMEALNLSAAEQSSLRLPIYDLAGDSSENSEGLMEKEILRAGTINYKGNKVTFSEDDLAAAESNFSKNPVPYVPFQLADKDNNHSDSPTLYGGTMETLRRSPDGKSLIGGFRLKDDVKEMVKHNPKFGVSVKLHPNYIRETDNQHFGPTIMHVAGVHRPRVLNMADWNSKEVLNAAMSDDDEMVVNLSEDGEYEYDANNEIEETSNTTEANEEGGKIIMADGDQNVTLTTNELNDMISNAVSTALAPLQEKNTSLESQVQNLSEGRESDNKKRYEDAVKASSENYRQQGVPRIMVDLAEQLLLSFDKDQANHAIELSEGEGENATTTNVPRVALVGKILENAKNFVDLSEEKGNSNDEVELSQDDDAAVDYLLGHIN